MGADVEKSSVMKSLLATVPEAQRGVLEAVLKAQDERSARLEKDLSEERRLRREKEFVAKAEGFKHIGVDKSELGRSLMAIADQSPELYEKIEKTLRAADEQVAKGDLFKEIGSSQAGKVGDAWEMIQKAAQGWVQKSGQALSPAAAVEAYILTDEGRKMYADYMANHPSQRS